MVLKLYFTCNQSDTNIITKGKNIPAARKTWAGISVTLFCNWLIFYLISSMVPFAVTVMVLLPDSKFWAGTGTDADSAPA